MILDRTIKSQDYMVKQGILLLKNNYTKMKSILKAKKK
jgi:hypothetical protein